MDELRAIISIIKVKKVGISLLPIKTFMNNLYYTRRQSWN